MNAEFNRFLETGKITVFPRGKDLVDKELMVAQSDLLDAQAGFEKQRYKWSTIQGYSFISIPPFRVILSPVH